MGLIYNYMAKKKKPYSDLKITIQLDSNYKITIRDLALYPLYAALHKKKDYALIATLCSDLIPDVNLFLSDAPRSVIVEIEDHIRANLLARSNEWDDDESVALVRGHVKGMNDYNELFNNSHIRLLDLAHPSFVDPTIMTQEQLIGAMLSPRGRCQGTSFFPLEKVTAKLAFNTTAIMASHLEARSGNFTFSANQALDVVDLPEFQNHAPAHFRSLVALLRFTKHTEYTDEPEPRFTPAELIETAIENPDISTLIFPDILEGYTRRIAHCKNLPLLYALYTELQDGLHLKNGRPHADSLSFHGAKQQISYWQTDLLITRMIIQRLDTMCQALSNDILTTKAKVNVESVVSIIDSFFSRYQLRGVTDQYQLLEESPYISSEPGVSNCGAAYLTRTMCLDLPMPGISSLLVQCLHDIHTKTVSNRNSYLPERIKLKTLIGAKLPVAICHDIAEQLPPDLCIYVMHRKVANTFPTRHKYEYHSNLDYMLREVLRGRAILDQKVPQWRLDPLEILNDRHDSNSGVKFDLVLPADLKSLVTDFLGPDAGNYCEDLYVHLENQKKIDVFQSVCSGITKHQCETTQQELDSIFSYKPL